ncbi:hypothetical protein AAZX31_02G107200 [Glycine max]|uniref:DUF155 domain-containing protein n=3 Tax=Glycine subgen. Soja TaxID=1462606 RepID=I1JEA1_SOYBN|nr:protein RETARDED ROOT GROWTH, mitochondrial [Glycine max]XP_028202935.1 uncharacterized protein LOC114387030 [Glycine soja]KAG5051477.1 hypothetical protein JHK87_003675 [Glycine soja]KAG5079748.1 hypothetical protein JHK86_003813 [Glycine max]KAH1059847.1 hypothetical protein GYH30_003705 [Glycine max]KAH1261110.1 Sporulation protein RMD1 [Glycine max]KHN02001.1 Sporulation protein RMD1 [Glycine soja]|eukprot:XP_003518751.1 uncharacterized protein LOC100792982 [Glycine max]
MGGRWRTLSSFYNRITTSFSYSSKPHFPSFNRSISLAAAATSEIPDPDQFGFVDPELDPCVKIPVKAYFLSTSINLKGIQADNHRNVVPPSSRSSSNYVALRFCDFNLDSNGHGFHMKASNCRYMVVYQYGSAVLFNIEDHEVESYLELVKRHASGLLQDMRKDDYAIKEKPLQVEDMQGGPDYIVLKSLDTDGIRIIGSVLGQSIALDYFVSQVDGLVEEFAGINRGMEKTGTFTMDKKKLLQLVGKANSNLADVILKVGLFERSEIAWRDAKYAQIYEYLRDEYEVAQRFGNLDFKLKFVEHNIHFLQEVLQNRKSDFLEWCIIGLLTIENVLSLYEILGATNTVS